MRILSKLLVDGGMEAERAKASVWVTFQGEEGWEQKVERYGVGPGVHLARAGDHISNVQQECHLCGFVESGGREEERKVEAIMGSISSPSFPYF